METLGVVFIDAPIRIGASADRYPMVINPTPGLYSVGIDRDTSTITLTRIA